MRLFLICVLCSISACSWAAPTHVRAIGQGMPDVDLDNAIYEVPVKPGVSYQDLIDSLKSISEGMNFVNPANFPIGEHMKLRGQDPQGVKEVRTFCNLSMGTEIILDHPEFLVFAPCRLAIYEKPDANGKRQLFLGLDRPTHDLKNIKQPTARAQASAQQLEDALIQLMEKARRGDF
ncbi:DUF302 domain-containing protein [Methylophilus medardicus]|uniref:DUF302 domain-containing protein n=2 Tax=Methylophilus medardicus TaxID=2588534 RepID=A0A5B8CS30_9PROT|nr:DUF302 domain-containing protein [Methylophilus medardicus]QDC43876.1 DUF302 domain-containing protein [Methylophilus medardicus]QDC48883.1 DUF302 domain-containing protein [Methylophilus medardicus]QDC52588.1 DUF302 domain-containing protein [Methylophilus medardicus]